MEILKDKDHIIVFIKSIVFQQVGISWLIQTSKATEFKFEKEFLVWVKKGPWYNQYICASLFGSVLEIY